MVIGYIHAGDTRDFICRTGDNPKIVHDVSGKDIMYFGIYPFYPFLDHIRLRKPTRAPPLDLPYYSSASLDKVRSTSVFHDENWHRCGVMVEYTNGVKQAVGECRIGIDHVEYTDSPKYLFLACFTYSRDVFMVKIPAYRIKFAKEAKEHDANVGEQAGSPLVWSCYPMAGILELWFCNDRALPNVLENPAALAHSIA